jgi:hypothetical protein
LSILLIATMIGTLAALAWLMDSIVCGITLSVGRDHQDRDVGGLRTTGTHRRKGRVTGRVDEGDLLAVLLDLIGADMLGDAARFSGDDIGLADGIQERGLAVVDMAHDRHDRRTRLQLALVVGDIEDAGLDVGFRYALDRMAEFRRDELGQVGIDDVAGLHHLAFLHQVLDHIDGAFRHALRQFLNGDGLGQRRPRAEIFSRVSCIMRAA